MAVRREYAEGTWEPGDPLFERPRTNEQGNHIRPMVEYLGVLPSSAFTADPDKCYCHDKASWPEPLFRDDLGSVRHAVLAVPFTD